MWKRSVREICYYNYWALKFNSCFNSQTITGLTSTVYHYTTNLNAGTEVLLYVADSSGEDAWSGNVSTYRLSQAMFDLNGTLDHYWGWLSRLYTRYFILRS